MAACTPAGYRTLFHYQSIEALVFLYRNTGVSGFIEWRINNSHLLIRLGDVWVVMALIIWITRIWKNMPALIPKIGSETLTIYSVHYISCYGAHGLAWVSIASVVRPGIPG